MAVKDKTSFETWYCLKPNVEHLKVFACLCYTHVPDVKRDKLDQKADIGIFVDYNSMSRGYRLFNLKTKKSIVSRDIKFDEVVIWNWEKEEKEVANLDQHEKTIAQVLGDVEEEVGANNFDDTPVRGTKPLHEMYERCDVVLQEPTSMMKLLKKVDGEL